MKSAWFYLAFLTLQNAAVTLTVRTTKLRPFIDETGAVVPYSVGMTVVIGELIKTVVCLFMSIYNNEQQPAGKRGRASPSEIVSALSSSVAENWWRVGVPAVLFSFQNFLNVSGGGRLPPAGAQQPFQQPTAVRISAAATRGSDGIVATIQPRSRTSCDIYDNNASVDPQ